MRFQISNPVRISDSLGPLQPGSGPWDPGKNRLQTAVQITDPSVLTTDPGPRIFCGFIFHPGPRIFCGFIFHPGPRIFCGFIFHKPAFFFYVIYKLYCYKILLTNWSS